MDQIMAQIMRFIDLHQLIGSIQNIAFLLCLTFIYDSIFESHTQKSGIKQQCIAITIISIIMIMIIIFSWQPFPKVNIDSRAILLSISGLFFTPIAPLILAIVAITTDLALHNNNIIISLILTTIPCLLGLGFNYVHRKRAITEIKLKQFYLLGLLFSVLFLIFFTIVCLTLTSKEITLSFLHKILAPYLLLFPLATMLLAHLFQEQIQRTQKLETELQNSFLFEQNFNMSHIGLVITDAQRHWLKFNLTLCQMFGYTEQEFQQLKWIHLTHPDDLNKELKLQQALYDGDIERYELDKRYIAKDKSIVYGHVTTSCQRDKKGHVTLIISSVFDITQTYKAKLAKLATEQQLNLVLKTSLISTFDVDIRSISEDTQLKNNIIADLLNVPPTQLTRKKWVDGIHSDDKEITLTKLKNHLTTSFNKTSIHYEYRFISAKNEVHWILDQGSVTEFDEQGKPLRFCGITMDITQRKKIEEPLNLVASVYNTSQEGMAVLDRNGYLISVNKAFTRITGFNEQEIQKRHLFDFKNNLISEQLTNDIQQAVLRAGQWQGEVQQYNKSGEIYTIWFSINSILDIEGTLYRYIVLFFDITEQKKTEQLIWQQANYDTLTNLPNRRLLSEFLTQEIAKSKRSCSRFAVLFLDLDNFKEVNDIYGHSHGDQLLLETTKRLQTCIREMDIIARFGGDEFIVVLSAIEGASFIEFIVNRVMDTITEPFDISDKKFYISTSIGIAIYPNDGQAPDQLIKHADQAMYEAKTTGRNKSCYFTPNMQLDALLRLRIIQELRQALIRKEFVLYYQPIIELTTTELTTIKPLKAEALIRWDHPKHGLISPNDFIHLAELSGLIIDIGDWVFKEATSQIAKWRDQYGVLLQISINKSPLQFRDEHFYINDWLAHLEKLNLNGDQVNIEITEGLLLDNNQKIYDKLNQYHQANIKISLDDFGTGYSSLSYIQKFDIDYIKIDRSFVQDLETDDENLALCQAIIDLAHKLNLKVIAEGIETVQQQQLLQINQCDYGQGYLFSKPLSAKEYAQKYFTKKEVQ